MVFGSYRCVDNDATEEQIVEFPGVLFVTVGKVVFHGNYNEHKVEVILLYSMEWTYTFPYGVGYFRIG